MYDKRYSDQQIKRIRQTASASMFFVMFLLCIGVAKTFYWIGHQDGYADGYQARLFEDVKPASSFVPTPARAIAARLDIQSIPATTTSGYQRNHLRNSINWILKYWFWGCIAVALWAFYKVFTYPRRNSAHVIGSDNVIIQSHSERK